MDKSGVIGKKVSIEGFVWLFNLSLPVISVPIMKLLLIATQTIIIECLSSLHFSVKDGNRVLYMF